MKYLALLRGINVGGKNLIKMAELKECFEKAGLKNAATYIQSGNVIFEHSSKSVPALTSKIEKLLSKTFNYKSKVIIISKSQFEKAIESAPKRFGTKPKKFRYDVIFLKDITPKEAMKSLSTKEGVDTADLGKGVIYFSRLDAKATQSRLSRVVGTPAYKSMSIRNWNTATKLLSLMTK